MGIYPPGSSDRTLNKSELNSVQSNGVGLPQMRIRQINKTNLILGRNALPEGFVLSGLPTFKYPSIQNDVDYTACSYLKAAYDDRSQINGNYIDFYFTAEFAKEPLGTIFDVDPDAVMQTF